jgi:hypothetical protein
MKRKYQELTDIQQDLFWLYDGDDDVLLRDKEKPGLFENT